MTRPYRPLLSVFAALLLALPAAWARAGEPLPFTADTLARVRAQYEGEPFLLVLWSVHCAPCVAELALLGERLAQDPGFPLVLVATDPPEEAADVRLMLADHGLEDFPSWQFAGDFPERLRYLIDPDWFGELPRSYFHDAAHRGRAHSGALDEEMLALWRESPQE